MRLRVISLGGASKELRINGDETLDRLKRIIATATAVPHYVRLFLLGSASAPTT